MATQVSKRKQAAAVVETAAVAPVVEAPVAKRGRKPRAEQAVVVEAEPVVDAVPDEAAEPAAVEVSFLSELERYISSRRARRETLKEEELELRRELGDLDSLRRRYLVESKATKKKVKRTNKGPSRPSYMTIPRPMTKEFTTFLANEFPEDQMVPNSKGAEVLLPGVKVGDRVCPKDISRYLKVYITKHNLREGSHVKLDKKLRSLMKNPVDTCLPFGIQTHYNHHFLKPEADN